MIASGEARKIVPYGHAELFRQAKGA